MVVRQIYKSGNNCNKGARPRLQLHLPFAQARFCNCFQIYIFALPHTFSEIQKRVRTVTEQKSKMIYQWEQDQQLVEQSMYHLAGVLETKHVDAVKGAYQNHDLFAACSLVGSFAGIDVKFPEHSKHESESPNVLDDIAKESRFRYREILLRGAWWREDHGAILAFIEEDKRPVALIPLSPNTYELHDPHNQTKSKITLQSAEKLLPFAFEFYRPFPNKAMNLKDIISFGIESSWKRDWVRILCLGIVGGVLTTVMPIVIGIIFDSVIPQGERMQLIQIGFLLSSIAITQFLFLMCRSIAMLRIEGKMDRVIQSAIWDRLLSLPISFFKQYNAGELSEHAMGISNIRRMLSGTAITTILSGIFSIFNMILLFYYSKSLAIYALILVMVAVIVTGLGGYLEISYERDLIRISKKIAGFILQVVGGVSKFRTTGAENRVFYKWAQRYAEQRKKVFQSQMISIWMNWFTSIFPIISMMVLFYFTAAVPREIMGTGKFIAFNAAFISFITMMINVSQVLIQSNHIIPIYEDAKPILSTLPEYDEVKKNPGRLKGSIEISHISFRYSEDGPLILQDISFDINPGEYIGIVGSSGCGKSTLLRLLLGFEKPQNGCIYYDGQDLEKIDIRSVRKQLGVVLQNSSLMSGDIFSNILAANTHLTMDDAVEAAKMSGLYEDIQQMPMGFHTVVNEGGSTLSGGQRQRLLIARAIVNKPQILFFDEATSALDNKTQAVVSESLDGLEATRIVIAHRLSTIRHCDRIIVFDQGKVVEMGTYEKLMNQNGLFFKLAERQLA